MSKTKVKHVNTIMKCGLYVARLNTEPGQFLRVHSLNVK